MTKPLLKICGITNTVDALTAIKAGADWLGFIFVPNTPRFVSLEQAQAILGEVRQKVPSVSVVGVFQNASEPEIQRHVDVLSLDRIQLHGQEAPDFCNAFSVPVIKTLLLDPEPDFSALRNKAQLYLEQGAVQLLLLDLPKSGTLKAITECSSTNELRGFFQDFPCLMAGGLKPENVFEALSRFQSLGVDVASGVEQSVGKKDTTKLTQFCQLVQGFELQANRGDNQPCSL